MFRAMLPARAAINCSPGRGFCESRFPKWRAQRVGHHGESLRNQNYINMTAAFENACPPIFDRKHKFMIAPSRGISFPRKFDLFVTNPPTPPTVSREFDRNVQRCDHLRSVTIVNAAGPDRVTPFSETPILRIVVASCRPR